MAEGKDPKPKKIVPTGEEEEELKPQSPKSKKKAAPKPKAKPKAKEIAPGIGDVVEDPRYSPSGKALKMKEFLMKQPKVLTMVPLAPGEKPGATIPITINGYRLNVKKGIMVNVPQQIAEMIRDSFHATSIAGQEYKADRTPGHEVAL